MITKRWMGGDQRASGEVESAINQQPPLAWNSPIWSPGQSAMSGLQVPLEGQEDGGRSYPKE